MRLPIGLIYTDTGEIDFDPDRAIVEAIELVFSTFRRLGSAMQTLKWFRKNAVTLPSRPYRMKGQVHWSVPNHSHIQRIIHNPRYAGCFAYGRTRTRVQCWTGASTGAPERRGPASVASALRALRTSNEGSLCRRTPETQGVGALILLLSAQCRSPWHPDLPEPAWGRYRRGGIGLHLGGRESREHRGWRSPCASRCAPTLAAVDRQHVNRIEALRHEADLARRRFMEVDPQNRLVAATLEAEWNTRLAALEQAIAEREQNSRTRDSMASAEQEERLLELANDFGKVWNASATGNAVASGCASRDSSTPPSWAPDSASAQRRCGHGRFAAAAESLLVASRWASDPIACTNHYPAISTKQTMP